MIETWEQMEDRHRRERSAMMLAISSEAAKRGFSTRHENRSTTMKQINQTTSEIFEIDPDRLLGPARDAKTVEARRYAFVQARDAGYSLTQIGNFWGGRDHTTVLWGIKRAKANQGSE